ncbi:testis-expressed protein 2-like [Littorina saxatilis]|uniref:SMP-LTD domain-containing protein n=1 Tax=Littorina saxatilis TaxID=31220 RepID=A0AAN9BXF8_9CAEN
MSLKKGAKPPARPPPPKGGLSLGGMSFKKLEQEEEEEEEDLTISDKYTTLLQQSRNASAPAGLSSGGRSSTPSPLTTAKPGPLPLEAEDVDKIGQLKKSGKAKLEYLSGLKGRIQERIQERITKTKEDVSGESSASASPDKDHPLSGSLSDSVDCKTPTGQDDDETLIAKVSAVKMRASSPPVMNRTQSVSQSDAPKGEERRSSLGSLEKRSSSHPVKLSSLMTNDDEEEENIMVVEEHFKEEPFEDFAGGLVTSTKLRSRSKLKKTSATVSMSDLMKTPTEKAQDFNNVFSEEKNPEKSTKDSPGKSRSKISLARFMSHDGHTFPWSKLVALTACVFAYLVLPVPSFLSGVIAGCVLMSLGWSTYNFVVMPGIDKEPPKLTPIEDLPPMEIPEMNEPTLDDGNYKGWMNEITNYNPDDYHINHTYSVLVTLEGTTLRLQRPKVPVPRRAMYDEMITTAHFVHQRHFELKGSRVFLLPPGLIKKRVWSKKYPLCIALAETGTKSKHPSESSVDSGESVKLAKQEMGFEFITEEKCDSSVLYLFARTCREKEEWYLRFNSACQGRPLPNAVLEMRRMIERQRQKHVQRGSSDGSTRQRHNSSDSQSSVTSDSGEKAEAEPTDSMLDFTRYMGHLMPAGAFTRLLSPAKNDKESGAPASRLPFTGSIICDSQLYWLNALIGRCFYDFLRDTWWSERVKDKLQRKLSKIHVPYFIDQLQVTAIDMGKAMPVIRRAANPYLDERGFWVELDVSYGGGFQMTIETKMNLMKLKTAKHDMSKGDVPQERSPVTDSDEEDSAESSTDEEEEAMASPEEKESGGKKLMKYLNKLTSSKYFQQATEYKYIKRAMENVSNTPLQLQVTVKNLVGKMVVNVPHPPSDRLWYGFRTPPRLWLSAKPQVGERVVTITHVTDWIEKKLEVEFQRVFVMPNMDDLVIPILRPSAGVGEQTDDSNGNIAGDAAAS